jgi:hypothetical protein
VVTPVQPDPNDTTARGRIAQPVRGRALHRFFWKRLRVPRRVVHSALSAAKFAGNPNQVRLRRALANDPVVTKNAFADIRSEDGYMGFPAGKLERLEEIVGRCRAIFEEQRGELSEQAFVLNRNKLFLLSVLAGDDFCRYPELLRFMVSRPILDTATRYLGTVPLLAGANLWWSPPNTTAAASQLFHTDNEDWRQLKVFINLFDTDEDHGPFTFLPAGLSEDICQRTRYVTGRLSDEQVFSRASAQDLVRLTGPPGSGAFVDTSRCLHFGSRGNSADRLVLAFQFMRFDSPTESTSALKVPADLGGLEADPIQKLALGWR